MTATATSAGKSSPDVSTFNLPFGKSKEIRRVLASPANVDAIVKYLETAIVYDADTFPELFLSLIVTDKYKKKVYWPARTGR